MLLTTICVPLLAAMTVVGCRHESPVAASAAQTSTSSDDVGGNEPEAASAILAGGCFWCVESDFDKLPGVIDVVSGYSGGTTENPTYENYASGNHVEVVKVTYDPTQVTYAGLVEWLIKHSDPTDDRGSFVDRGPQYRPVVYYETEQQKSMAEDVIQTVEEMAVYDEPLVIEVAKRQRFWRAEEYHQDYAENSLVKYKYYRYQSGRDAFIEEHWGDRASGLELPPSTPSQSASDKKAAGAPPTVAADRSRNDSESGENFVATDLDDGEFANDHKQPWKDFRAPTDAQLQSQLTNTQYEVTQKDGTETAFENKYWDNKAVGIYVDIVSGEPLFSSADKFESGTGWPSFVKPLDSKFVQLREDNTWFTSRTEVRSKIADSHLGHVFNDGPPSAGGKRWCMNSAAMSFIPLQEMKARGYGDYVPALKTKSRP